MQVDSHKLGLSLTADSKTVKTGDEGEALKPNWTIAKDGSLPITAAAAASAVSQTVTEESAASVVFTVGWDAAETPVQTISFTIDGASYTVLFAYFFFQEKVGRLTAPPFGDIVA